MLSSVEQRFSYFRVYSSHGRFSDFWVRIKTRVRIQIRVRLLAPFSDFVGLGWGMKFWVSNTFSGDLMLLLWVRTTLFSILYMHMLQFSHSVFYNHSYFGWFDFGYYAKCKYENNWIYLLFLISPAFF
jgi:hypothetical protein